MMTMESESTSITAIRCMLCRPYPEECGKGIQRDELLPTVTRRGNHGQRPHIDLEPSWASERLHSSIAAIQSVTSATTLNVDHKEYTLNLRGSGPSCVTNLVVWHVPT